MPFESVPAVRNGGGAAGPNRQSEYDGLRTELQRLMMAPVKDFLRIDQLVDQLELLQLAIKGEHGIRGNNPNE